VTQALFQSHSGTFSFTSMLLYGAIYWLMAAITYGAFIPSGLFTPSLIFGGLLGCARAAARAASSRLGPAAANKDVAEAAAARAGPRRRMWAEVLVAMHVADDRAVGRRGGGGGARRGRGAQRGTAPGRPAAPMAAPRCAAAGGLLRAAGRRGLPGRPHAHVGGAGADPHGDDAGAADAALPDAGGGRGSACGRAWGGRCRAPPREPLPACDAWLGRRRCWWCPRTWATASTTACSSTR
jgi:hypothetical protein